ncbi:hypothetical protein EJB05_54197 [Eragrostis curvula]|uniref:KIB1-4 beta-propeller domain-containing protein n=1 Tax=Eragrostis curvula TaxID=38414 RepID=A0A5J9SN08_9POAL|nr:hypothetical protein EJB05_54197 [Eragrostis curvula]
MGSGADTTGKVFDERLQEKRPRFDSEPASPWAGLQPDALGVVLRFLPCKADRSRLRSVCRHWRATSRGHAVPPPLPLLVLSRFRFASLSPRGALTPAQRAWMPQEVAGDHVRCVGSFGEWLVGTREVYGECFLVNAFSHEVVHLPCLSDSGYRCSMYLLHKVALSASPESGSECIVAAFGFRGSSPELSLWRPGMTSWHVRRDALIAGHIDMAFLKGKLYMLWRFTPCLVALELGEDERGVTVSRIEDCFVESRLPNPLRYNDSVSCNIVVWRGKLLLVIRYYGGSQARHNVLKVGVLALDFSTKPYGVTEINGFGSDCIFVGSGGCKSFPAGLHDGFEDELIYFVPDHNNPHDAFVYNMKDGAVRPFAIESRPGSIVGTPQDSLGFPVWLFPSE